MPHALFCHSKLIIIIFIFRHCSQVLLKERALNTEQLVNQHKGLKDQLTVEKKAKKKAENAAAKLKKTNEGMQSQLKEQGVVLQHLVEQVQLLSDIVTSDGGVGSALASGSRNRADAVSRAEMNALQAKVAKHDEQIRQWNRAMKEVTGGGGNGGKKRTAVGGGGAELVEEDPVRARAVEMYKANKRGAPQQQQQQQQEQPPLKKKKMFRVNEDPGQLQQFIGGSAGGSEAAAPGFADVAIAALRAVMGADAEQPPSALAVQDAVKVLGINNNSNNHSRNGDGGENANTTNTNNNTATTLSSQKRNTIAAFACAVLECAAAAPARRFAAPSLSPRHWFEAAVPVRGKKSKDVSHIPSFLGVWCSSEVLQRHSLPWLLHCAVEISAAAQAEKKEEEEEGEEKKTQNLCHILAQDLASLVIKDLATSTSRPALHTPTELCAAAAAAGALWRSQGDYRSFQVFILDIMLSKLDSNEIDALAPLTAAIESWPEAFFQNKGALGSGVHGLLEYLGCVAGKSSRILEVRLAATWLRKIGVGEWNWSEDLSEEQGKKALVEARKQLKKFVPTSLPKPVSQVDIEFI
jgi:hypothetical protein